MAGGGATPVGVSVPITKRSYGSPGLQVMSFWFEPVSPAGPQITSPWTDVGVKTSLSTP